MVEERVYVNRGSGAALFLGLLAVLAIVLGVLWLTGGLSVKHDAQNRVEITLDPGQAERASDNALKKTGKALENAGERLQQHEQKPAPAAPIVE